MTERWISVVASGDASVAPDMAVVSMSVSGKGRELGPTRDDVNRRTSSVLARLRELGVADADIHAPDAGIHPQYDYRKTGQKLVGYLVTRAVSARVRELDTLGAVLDGAVSAGANELHGAQMTASDPSMAEHAALKAAVSAARAKAAAIAEASGVSLGAVARVEQDPGDGNVLLPRGGMMAMAEATDVPTEVAAGDLTVTRRIRAWFDLG